MGPNLHCKKSEAESPELISEGFACHHEANDNDAFAQNPERSASLRVLID